MSAERVNCSGAMGHPDEPTLYPEFVLAKKGISERKRVAFSSPVGERGESAVALWAAAPRLLWIAQKISACYGNQGGAIYRHLIDDLRAEIKSAETR